MSRARDDSSRRRPLSIVQSLLTALPLFTCVVVAVLGLAWLSTDHFRRGCALIGGSLLLAGALRSVLPERAAGLLAVRAKWIDVTVDLLGGALLVVVAAIVPPTR